MAATVHIHQKVLDTGIVQHIAQFLSPEFGLVLSWALEVDQPFRMRESDG